MNITKFQISSKMSKNQLGFTIIELLVVMIILLSVGGLVGSIFFISLRSTNKSNLTAAVRQNGNAAITQIARQIRYAEKLEGLGNVDDATLLPSNCNDGIVDPPKFNILKVSNTNPLNDTTEYTTFACVDTDGDSLGDVLTINNEQITDRTKTKISDCSFSCINKQGVTTINVKFNMGDINGGTDTGINENVVKPIKFSTSVTMRNTQ